MSQNANQITLRGMPVELVKEIKSEAKRLGLSLSQVLLNRLQKKPAKKQSGACADLMKLAGTWDKKMAGEFDRNLSESRKIDRKMWES